MQPQRGSTGLQSASLCAAPEAVCIGHRQCERRTVNDLDIHRRTSDGSRGVPESFKEGSREGSQKAPGRVPGGLPGGVPRGSRGTPRGGALPEKARWAWGTFLIVILIVNFQNWVFP